MSSRSRIRGPAESTGFAHAGLRRRRLWNGRSEPGPIYIQNCIPIDVKRRGLLRPDKLDIEALSAGIRTFLEPSGWTRNGQRLVFGNRNRRPEIVYPGVCRCFPLSRVEPSHVGARGGGAACPVMRRHNRTSAASPVAPVAGTIVESAWRRGLQWSDRRIAGRRAFTPGRQWRGSSCVCRYSHRLLARHHRASAVRRWRYDEHSYPHRGGELSYGTPAGGTAVLGTSRFRIECPTCP